MELDARGHGYDGKLHADRWTAEYVGRGNHALDAACFRATRAVSWRSRTLAPPPPPPAALAAGDGHAHVRTVRAAVRELRAFYFEAQVLSAGDAGGPDTDTASPEALARVRLDRRAQLMGLPSASVLSSAVSSAPAAARSAAGHPYSGGARTSWRERARQLVMARVQEAEALGGGAAEATNGASDGGTAETDVTMEDEALAAERSDGSRSAWRLYQSSSSSTANADRTGRDARTLPWLEAEEEEEEEDMRYYQMLARNGSDARTRSATGSTSTTTTSSSSNSGMHFAFTLSSRTLQHMRSRYERRRLRRSSEKQRFDHCVAVGFSLGKLPLKMNARAGRSHADDGHLHADDEKIPLGHEDLGLSARSLAYVGKTGRVVSNGKTYLQCDKFGAGDVVGCGLLFDSKTFFFTLNGKLTGMLAATEVHHLDFLVEQGDDDAEYSSDRLASMFDWHAEEDGESDPDGYDAEIDGDDDATMSDADLAEDGDELFPSLSLHRPGECVRTVFAANEFKFDLFTFQKQVLKERQRSLGADATPRAKRKQVDDDAVMDALVLDYFKHYGYEDSFATLQTAIKTANSPSKLASPSENDYHDDLGAAATDQNHSTSQDQAEYSLALRSEVRRCLREFETASALEMIDRLPNVALLKLSPRYQRVMLFCRMLCVLDVAQSKPPKSNASAGATNASGAWSAEKAIMCAQSVFADLIVTDDTRTIDDTALRDDLALFMSVLLYENPSQVPADSRARLFLTSEFRERVADELNSILLAGSAADDGSSSMCASPSSLEVFLADLSALRAISLRHGCCVFPESAASLSTQLSASRKRKEQQRRAREENGGGDDDDDDELSSGSDASSSSASSRGGRQRHNDDDDDDEEEEEEEE